MIINVDIDNTVNDFAKKVISVYNNLYHDNVSYDTVTDYGFGQLTKISRDCLEELFFKNNYFYESLEPIQGSVDHIQRLVNDGHKVKFVSAADYSIVQSRLDFVKTYFPYLDVNDSLILTKDKHYLWADFVIDDCPSNLTNVNRACRFVLFDSPWNRHISAEDWVKNPNNLDKHVRCSTWEQVVDTVFHEEIDRQKKLLLASKALTYDGSLQIDLS